MGWVKPFQIAQFRDTNVDLLAYLQQILNTTIHLFVFDLRGLKASIVLSLKGGGTFTDLFKIKTRSSAVSAACLLRALKWCLSSLNTSDTLSTSALIAGHAISASFCSAIMQINDFFPCTLR
eukprot:Platyproteum_vivax@DN2595_c0_g1_i1.p1